MTEATSAERRVGRIGVLFAMNIGGDLALGERFGRDVEAAIRSREPARVALLARRDAVANLCRDERHRKARCQ